MSNGNDESELDHERCWTWRYATVLGMMEIRCRLARFRGTAIVLNKSTAAIDIFEKYCGADKMYRKHF